MSLSPRLSPTPSFRRNPLRSSIALAALAITCALAAPGSAQAKSKTNPPQGTTGTTKQKGATKTTYRPSPSEETRAERERRLFRECRGMHDAGACKGFTRR